MILMTFTAEFKPIGLLEKTPSLAICRLGIIMA